MIWSPKDIRRSYRFLHIDVFHILLEIVAKAGILVDPFSVSAITDALDHLIKEQTEREQMAVNARRQAKRFSWPASAARLHAVISELC